MKRFLIFILSVIAIIFAVVPIEIKNNEVVTATPDKHFWVFSSSMDSTQVANIGKMFIENGIMDSIAYKDSLDALLNSGKVLVADSSMCIIKTGDTLLIRTVFDETRDLVQKVRIKNEYVIGDNSTVNFWGTYLIPNTNTYTYAGMYASSVKIHANTDDAAPYKINDALFGGNHGFDYMRLVTSTGHGLTTTDVGSEWTDWSAVKYYPVRIVDENSFWLLSENSSATDVWSFDPDPDGNLWNGADSLMIESYGHAQMRPSIKDHEIKCYINDTRLTDDGTYYCDNLTIDEYYAISDPSACLDSLIAHAGEADNIYVNR